MVRAHERRDVAAGLAGELVITGDQPGVRRRGQRQTRHGGGHGGDQKGREVAVLAV